MDALRFDRLTRSLVAGASRRRLLAGLAAGLGLALGRARVEAKKKKNKKKRCRKLQQACSEAKRKRCCKGLSCGEKDFFECEKGHDYCCGKAGTSCESLCDCCGELSCRPHSKTCQMCVNFGTPCTTATDCCSPFATCSSNGCTSANVCCNNAGDYCFDDCDCCGNLLCVSGVFGNRCQ